MSRRVNGTMTTAIVTDSTAYLTKEEREAYNIHMVPLSVIIDDKSYEEEVTITMSEFYDRVRNEKNYQKQRNHQSVNLLRNLRNLQKNMMKS